MVQGGQSQHIREASMAMEGLPGGGGVSFRQGAGAASPVSPDLETAAAEQRGFREKGLCFQGFLDEG